MSTSPHRHSAVHLHIIRHNAEFYIIPSAVLTSRVGLDLTNGCVCDNKKAGVLEPAVSKIKSLKFATEAAITILRIDDMIKVFPDDKKHRSYQDAYNADELE